MNMKTNSTMSISEKPLQVTGTTNSSGVSFNQAQPHGHGGLMNESSTIRDSMQYYRVWIYSCNTVLGITSAIFIIFGAFVLVDSRLSFLRDVELYHPTFLYAYLALVIQSGVIQSIGYVGASRLSHKLLSLYWILLLLLTLGDMIVGLVWVFKLDKVKLSLKPGLTSDLMSKYNRDDEWSRSWNDLQSMEHCCGVSGPLDYKKFLSVSSDFGSSGSSSIGVLGQRVLLLPDSCCTLKLQVISNINLTPSVPVPVSSSGRAKRKKRTKMVFRSHEITSGSEGDEYTHSMPGGPMSSLSGATGTSTSTQHRVRHFVHHRKKVPWNSTEVNGTFPSAFFTSDTGISSTTSEPSETLSEISEPFQCHPSFIKGPDSENLHRNKRNVAGVSVSNSNTGPSITTKSKIRVYGNGCSVKLLQWLDHVSGVLFILGFCIIGFIKVIFLLILRYEIREMIEKIHLLDNNDNITKLPGITSPRSGMGGAGTNFLQKQYSTQSGGTQITIKSPVGDGTPNFYSNHNPQHPHYLTGQGHHHHHPHSYRRPSARSLGDGHRSTSHSQETVNMTLLITREENISDGVGNTNESGEETISLKVPTPEERGEASKRTLFANYCAWESNVSGDSSVSGGYADQTTSRCGCPSETELSACAYHGDITRRRTEVVEVDLEQNHRVVPTSKSSSFEESPNPVHPQHFLQSNLDERKENNSFTCLEHETIELLPIQTRSPINHQNNWGTVPLETVNCLSSKPYNNEGNNETDPLVSLNEEGGGGMTSSLVLSSVSTQSPPSISSPPSTPPSVSNRRIRKNGNNNNSASSSVDLDSDLVMALIGTAV